MRLLASALAILLLALSTALHAESRFYDYTLDNGLRVIVLPDHRAPIAVFQIWYKVGSSYEYEGITGISHMLEHLMFKGTQEFPEGEFVKIIAANGGDQNAFTSLDFTAYYEELEARRLPLAFALEADRMRGLTFDEKELETEREVVIEERRLRTEDNPVSRMYERYNTVAQAASPYRYPIIGWMDDLRRYTLQDIENWYNTWYAPNNAIIVVVGDVEPTTVLDLAEHYFGNIPRSKMPALKTPPEVPPLGERRIDFNTVATTSYVFLGYNVPVINTATEAWEPYALDVLVGVLDGGESARLTKDLIKSDVVAAEIGAQYNSFDRLDTLLLIGGIPAPGRTPQELETALGMQVSRLQNELIDPTELERVKNQVIASDIYARDSLTLQAVQIGSLASVGLIPDLMDDYIQNISAVTAEQVQQVSKRYLTADRLTVGELIPQSINKETP